MKMKLMLSGVALVAFAALPAFAQHGGSHGGGTSSSSHGASSNAGMQHGNSENAQSGNSSASSSKSSNASVSERLADNTKLAGKLQSLLPAGTDLKVASQGFTNLGQFVAAVHVSHNLGIPFDQLKAKMIGPPSESLGDAIHALKPDANSKEESEKGEQQAKQDMDDSKKPS
jgi:hypothetical protein